MHRVTDGLVHPEPELIDHLDEAASRPALEALGRAVWDEALRYLYVHAAARPTDPTPYGELRRAFFGETGEPSAAPEGPTTRSSGASRNRNARFARP